MCVDNLKLSYCPHHHHHHHHHYRGGSVIERLTRDQEVWERHFLVSLSKTLYPMPSGTGLTKIELS